MGQEVLIRPKPEEATRDDSCHGVRKASAQGFQGLSLEEMLETEFPCESHQTNAMRVLP